MNLPAFYRNLALSDARLPRLLRAARRAVLNFSMPAPRVVVVPLVSLFLALRSVYYFLLRVFVCEPFFKSYCAEYGRNVHTGVYLHWIQGRGNIVIGDNVTLDGKCSLTFAVRYSERPTLEIGDHTGIGHNTSITVAKHVKIGRHCRIASGVTIFDSPGHPLDPADRQANRPARPEDANPVVIEDNVWIGRHATIMPGVVIGTGAVVAAGAVVMTAVPAYSLVAGNPARQLRSVATAARA